VSYPIKSELGRAHQLLCQASFFLVVQIVLKRYRPVNTREAYKKATEAVKALQNLIDGTSPLG
jgi:hypothetical protein